jgi:hypothetical protein
LRLDLRDSEVLNGGIHTYMHTYIHAYTYTYLAHTYIYIYLVQMLVDSKLDLAALGVVLFDLIAALRALKHHNNFMLSSSLKPKPETRNLLCEHSSITSNFPLPSSP